MRVYLFLHHTTFDRIQDISIGYLSDDILLKDSEFMYTIYT